MTAAAFKATYSDFKLIKGRKVVQFVFEVPLEIANEAYEILGGMPNPAAEIWCAVARLNGAVSAEGASADASISRPRHVDPMKRLAQRAGILCNDPVFARYLHEHHGAMINLNPDEAASWMREFCHVESRADIVPGSEAATRLDLLQSSFIAWRDVA